MKLVLYKCSGEDCPFQALLRADAKDIKIGDICLYCGSGTISGEDLYKEIDPTQFPTLATYQPQQIWDAVARLQEKDPSTTEHMALVNLEMDLAQINQMALG